MLICQHKYPGEDRLFHNRRRDTGHAGFHIRWQLDFFVYRQSLRMAVGCIRFTHSYQERMNATRSPICSPVSVFSKLGIIVPGMPSVMNLASASSSIPCAAFFRTTLLGAPPAPFTPWQAAQYTRSGLLIDTHTTLTFN